jgi:F0F1-type ATP synthase beta subunit
MELGFDFSIVEGKEINHEEDGNDFLFLLKRIFRNKQVRYKVIFMNSKCFAVVGYQKLMSKI